MKVAGIGLRCHNLQVEAATAKALGGASVGYSMPESVGGGGGWSFRLQKSTTLLYSNAQLLQFRKNLEICNI